VGSIFRTADAAGVKKIYLAGYTPTPVDRFGRVRRDFTKVSLGAEKLVLWEYHKNILKLLEKLKREKIYLIALEQAKSSIDYKKVKPKIKTTLVLGNEVRGLSKGILNKCDVVAEIPMRGKKESLNVSVAAGIFLFQLS